MFSTQHRNQPLNLWNLYLQNDLEASFPQPPPDDTDEEPEDYYMTDGACDARDTSIKSVENPRFPRLTLTTLKTFQDQEETFSMGTLRPARERTRSLTSRLAKSV